MLLAHICGATRVSTFMWANADSWQYYPWIGVNEEHHELSHAGDNDAVANEKLVKINVWHSEQVKYVLDQLALAKEVDGSSVLDNTLLLLGQRAGRRQHRTRTRTSPGCSRGGAGGYFKMGRYMKYADLPHNNLLVSVCNAMGLDDVTTFGIPGVCTGPLPRPPGLSRGDRATCRPPRWIRSRSSAPGDEKGTNRTRPPEKPDLRVGAGSRGRIPSSRSERTARGPAWTTILVHHRLTIHHRFLLPHSGVRPIFHANRLSCHPPRIALRELQLTLLRPRTLVHHHFAASASERSAAPPIGEARSRLEEPGGAGTLGEQRASTLFHSFEGETWMFVTFMAREAAT